MAAAMRGRTLRITTPAGTDLIVGVPDDQWFHLGNGDASRDRAARARSIRDREIELPVGMFNFVPHAPRVEGVLVADTILRAGPDVRGARLVLRRGRVVQAEAREGLESIHRAFRRIGPDGEKVATVWLDTHPLTERYGLRVELGSNWENGGRNRATGARRLAIALPDATVTADGVAILKDGRILWESISGGRWAVGSGQWAVGSRGPAYGLPSTALPIAYRLPPTAYRLPPNTRRTCCCSSIRASSAAPRCPGTARRAARGRWPCRPSSGRGG